VIIMGNKSKKALILRALIQTLLTILFIMIFVTKCY
jgi:hypothetical protein